jgi:hypothetical protein
LKPQIHNYQLLYAFLQIFTVFRPFLAFYNLYKLSAVNFVTDKLDDRSIKALEKALEQVKSGELAPKGGFVSNLASYVASASRIGETHAQTSYIYKLNWLRNLVYCATHGFSGWVLLAVSRAARTQTAFGELPEVEEKDLIEKNPIALFFGSGIQGIAATAGILLSRNLWGQFYKFGEKVTLINAHMTMDIVKELKILFIESQSFLKAYWIVFFCCIWRFILPLVEILCNTHKNKSRGGLYPYSSNRGLPKFSGRTEGFHPIVRCLRVSLCGEQGCIRRCLGSY